MSDIKEQRMNRMVKQLTLSDKTDPQIDAPKARYLIEVLSELLITDVSFTYDLMTLVADTGNEKVHEANQSRTDGD